MKVNTKKLSSKKPSKKKGYTPKETMRLARHEAAHFVIGWAVDWLLSPVDIRPSVRSQCRNDPSRQILAKTYGAEGASPFQHALIDLAGPVADNWGKRNAEILDAEKPKIDRALESIKEGYPLHLDDGDWDSALRQLIKQGFDVTVPTQAQSTLLVFIDAVRAILSLCESQWKEVTEYLIKHGRIGFSGQKINGIEISDQGEVASSFFSRWGEDGGDPPKAVSDCVEKYRFAVDALPKEPVEYTER